MNTIKSIRSIILASVAASLLVFVGFAVAEDPKPSATLTLKETEVGVLIGGDWGHGTLTYNGEPHMFHMTGAKLGRVLVSPWPR